MDGDGITAFKPCQGEGVGPYGCRGDDGVQTLSVRVNDSMDGEGMTAFKSCQG